MIKHKEWFIEYRIINNVFRRCLQVFIWDKPNQEIISFFKSYSIDITEDMIWEWFYIYVDRTDIIRLRNYDIWVLVHELFHFVSKMDRSAWIWEEAMAYVIEYTLLELLHQSKNKFPKIDDIFNTWNKNGTPAKSK